MEPIILVAAILAIIEIKRRSVPDAVINVFLPCFLLIPGLYAMHIPHLPAITFASAAIIPCSLAAVGRYGNQWKFTRTDIWVLLFGGGLFLAELASTGFANAGLALASFIFDGLMPYILGKLVLEQESVRERFSRRVSILLFFVAIISVWEFRMGVNLFTRTIGVLFPGQMAWIMQIRGGFVRIAGPFTGSILGGMVFLVGMLLSCWVGYIDDEHGTNKKYFGVKRSTILTAGIILGLLMTQSRGPEIGAVLGFLIARIGRAKNMKRTAIITIIICILGGVAGYIKAEQYTSGTIWEAKNIEQENAIYRRQLLDNYKPVVEKAPFVGYGVVDWPRIPGQPSIDNEFLFLQITQGKLGLWTFVLMGFEACLAVFRLIRKTQQRADIFFALTIAGAVLGLMMTLTTVYMGAQSYPLFFLLVGWSQSIRQTQTAASFAPQTETAGRRFRFKKVFA